MNNSIRTRGCKRCGGDLAKERDTYGVYFSCIQCGAEYPIPAQNVSVTGSMGDEKRDVVMSGYVAGGAGR